MYWVHTHFAYTCNFVKEKQQQQQQWQEQHIDM